MKKPVTQNEIFSGLIGLFGPLNITKKFLKNGPAIALIICN